MMLCYINSLLTLTLTHDVVNETDKHADC